MSTRDYRSHRVAVNPGGFNEDVGVKCERGGRKERGEEWIPACAGMTPWEGE